MNHVQDTLDELGSVLGKKRREVEELVEKIGLLRDTLDCTYTGRGIREEKEQTLLNRSTLLSKFS